MGYTTDFFGRFDLDRKLDEAHREYLQKFADTRRMKRSSSIADSVPDPVRAAVGLPVGSQGEYFVGAVGEFGMDDDPEVSRSIVDHNEPPLNQPGLWCQWVPSSDGMHIQWNGTEKFYNYIEWLKYIIENFLMPWGYVLNGSIDYEGENRMDRGHIIVQNNQIGRVKTR